MLNTQLVGFTKLRNIFAGTFFAVLLSCSLFATSSVQAQVIIDGEGFESPAYDALFPQPIPNPNNLPVGSLEGQLASLPGDGISTRWLASFGTESTAVVQTAVVHPSDPGGQAVRVDRTVGDSPSFWGAPVDAWPGNARYVCIVWDMLVEGPAGTAGTDFGPYFGVDAFDDVGVGTSDTGLIGSLGVLATSGDVVYTDEEIGLKQTGTKVNFGEWNRFHLDLDFELKQYTVYLNDPFLANPLITVPFVGGSGIGDGVGLNDFSDAPIGTFAFDTGFPGGADLAGTAYFDNYTVFQTNVKIPEPTTLVLGLVALVAVHGSRRRARTSS